MDYRPIPGQSDSGPSPGGPSDDVTSMAHDRMANLLMPYQDKYGAKPVAPPAAGGAPAGGGNAAPTSTEDKLYQAVHPETFNRVLDTIMGMVTGRAAPRQLGGGVGGGDYTVGEEGPERLQLTPGSSGFVTPNPATQMRQSIGLNVPGVNTPLSLNMNRRNPPSSGGFDSFRDPDAGFSAETNAMYKRNLVGEPGGPLSANATEQYKGMGLLPSGEPMRPVPGMAEGGSLEVPFPGMSGGMQYEPDFRPAVRGERVGDDVNPMAPKAGLSYQPTPTGIFRNFPYGPYHDENAGAGAGSPEGGSYAGPRPWRNVPAPSGAGPSPAGGDDGWKDYGEGIRYREGGGNGKPYPTVAPPDRYTPAMTPEQVELGERDKWAAPGYADRMNAEASARSPLTFNPNTNRAEGAVGRVTPGYEKGYYDAHPEERMMDMMTAANKPQMDAYQKQLDQFTNIIQGYGTAGMGQKEAAAARAEATRAIPMIQAEMEKLSSQGPAAMENAPSSPKNQELLARAGYYRDMPGVQREWHELASSEQFQAREDMLRQRADAAKDKNERTKIESENKLYEAIAKNTTDKMSGLPDMDRFATEIRRQVKAGKLPPELAEGLPWRSRAEAIQILKTGKDAKGRPLKVSEANIKAMINFEGEIK